MTAAAFSATFADWKLIKTRKCVQIVFEVPLEAADAAYQVLGGMPDPGVSEWFGIAKLKPVAGADVRTAGGQSAFGEKAAQHHPGGGHEVTAHNAQHSHSKEAGSDEPAPSRPRTSWDSMSAAQQAGILCADKAFQKFASEREEARSGGVACAVNEHRATEFVRSYCDVASRRDLDYAAAGNRLWNALVAEYRTWQQHPELVG